MLFFKQRIYSYIQYDQRELAPTMPTRRKENQRKIDILVEEVSYSSNVFAYLFHARHFWLVVLHKVLNILVTSFGVLQYDIRYFKYFHGQGHFFVGSYGFKNAW